MAPRYLLCYPALKDQCMAILDAADLEEPIDGTLLPPHRDRFPLAIVLNATEHAAFKRIVKSFGIDGDNSRSDKAGFIKMMHEYEVLKHTCKVMGVGGGS